jgi:hypothetical protein
MARRDTLWLSVGAGHALPACRLVIARGTAALRTYTGQAALASRFARPQTPQSKGLRQPAIAASLLFKLGLDSSQGVVRCVLVRTGCRVEPAWASQ